MIGPGFTAEQSLERRGGFRDWAAFAGRDAGQLSPQNILVDFGGPIPPPEPWPVPWGVDAEGNIIWKLWQFFPGGEGGAAVAGGSIWTTPIELGVGGTALVAVGAIAVGTLIGAGLGLGAQKLLTPPPPTPATPTPGCARVGPNTQHMITGSYWGCERSWNKTMQDADADCKSRAGICSGTCPSGAPCTPYANVYDSAQIPGVFACDTSFYYTCECGC